MLRDRPLNAKQELIQAVEYSANHPDLYDVLQLESANMSLFEYYCGDVLLCAIISFLILIIVIRKVVSYLLYELYRQNWVKIKKD